MVLRRFAWLVLLVLCVVFYWAYREWLSWFLLMAAVSLPWLSLVLSLPAMASCRISLQAPRTVTLGQEARGSCLGTGPLPLPRFRCKLVLEHCYTGQKMTLSSGAPLPTEHCGCLTLQIKKIRIQDYMGLFRLPMKSKASVKVLVRPLPVEMPNMPDLQRYLVNAWRPKAGGGFAENHELRQYRPGDNLRQIHWKLSAKTGQYILREPMEALRGLAVVTLELSGTPEELDRKLGRLFWVSSRLLEKDVPHRIHCFTGNGVEVFSVAREDELTAAVDALLTSPLAQPEAQPEYGAASWRCHIGGEADEE